MADKKGGTFVQGGGFRTVYVDLSSGVPFFGRSAAPKQFFGGPNDNDVIWSVAGFIFGFSTAGFGAALGGLGGLSVTIGLTAGTMGALNRRGALTESFVGGVQIGAFTNLIARSAVGPGASSSTSAGPAPLAPGQDNLSLIAGDTPALGAVGSPPGVPLAADTAARGLAGASRFMEAFQYANETLVSNPWLGPDPARQALQLLPFLFP